VVASLSSLFHRSLEAPVTARVLRAIFAGDRFAVHDALPLSDEGAANHTRLDGAHVFGWGRRMFGEAALPKRFPARQTLEASEAVARLAGLAPERALFWQQHPDGIDAGAFHTDVLAVGTGRLLLLHELAFVDARACVRELERRGVNVVLATEKEFPVADAVASYAFNSELVELGGGGLALMAPTEARENAPARAFLERVPVRELHFVDVNASMKNGGGPACLRLRVPLTEQERAEIRGRVLLDDALLDALEAWVTRNYRDRLGPDDLADPALLEETRAALDELTQILGLGSIYEFQS
jgi:succinylarginine dihydrolase